MSQDKPWIKTTPGTHPAFGELSKEEIKAAEEAIAAVRMSETPGRTQMSEKEKRLASATEKAELLKIDIDLWIEQKDKEKERFYRRAMIHELITCGRFDEALHYATGPKGGPLQGFKDSYDDILRLKAAVDRADDEECTCEREQVLADDGKTVLHLDRRYAAKEFYSIKHGQWVTAWRCRHCGHSNAHPGIPARQQRLADLRQIAAQIKPDHDLYHALSDKALLKVK